MHRETKNIQKMKAYKGFNKNEDGTLSCRGFVYEPRETYKHEGEIELCKSGFHACHELWQTWLFYPNNGKTVYYEVECGGEIIESDDDDGKFVCSEITLVKEIDMTHVQVFDEIWEFSEGFAKVLLDGKCNFINTEGKLLSEWWFDGACGFSERLATVECDGKYNFINTEGKLLSERWFDYVISFCGGFAWVNLGGKYNFINKEGKLLSEKWYDDVWNFSRGLARVGLDGKWNFINAEGEVLSEQWFDEVYSFSEGFAVVKLNGKWIKINTKGEIVL